MSNGWDDLVADAPGFEDQDRERNLSATQAQVQAAPPTAPAPPPSWVELTKNAPATQEFLTDPRVAAQLANDIHKLSAFEAAFGGWRDIAWETKEAWKRGTANTRLAEIGYRQSKGWATPEELAEADRIEAQQGSERPVRQSIIAGIPAAAAESLPLMARTANRSGDMVAVGAGTGLVGGAAVGSMVGGVGALPGAAAGFVEGSLAGLKIGMTREMAMAEKGLAYREYMKIPGVTHDAAAAASTVVGVVNGLLEVVPYEKVLQIPGFRALAQGGGARDVFRRILQSQTGRAAVGRAAGRLVAGVTLEGLTEAAQELSTVLGGQVASGDGVDLGKVDWGRVGEAGVKGAQAAVGMAGPGAGAGLHVDLAEVQVVKQRAAFWTALGQAASESETFQKLPAESQALVEKIQARTGGPVDAVTVPVEALKTLFQQNKITLEQVASRMPAVARQLDEAAGNPGVEVSIPIAEFAANVAPLPGYDALVRDIRVGDQLTLREAEKVEADAKTLAAEAKKEEGAPSKVEASPEQRVVQDVAAKLEAAGQDAEVARTSAALWGAFAKTMAGRVGAADAWAFYEGLGLQVEHEDVAMVPVEPGMQVAAQKVEAIATPEFKAWFGQSKIVDEAGAPLVVAHGTTSTFDTFQPGGDMGFHFAANRKVAKRIAETRRSEALKNADQGTRENGAPNSTGKARVINAFLAIKNPLRMKDMGDWVPSEVLDQLVADGVITEDETDAVRRPTASDVIRILERKGYDGIVYENDYEGGGDSYMAFRPEQIKSATGNRGTFDPADPNILHQPPQRAGAQPRGYVQFPDSREWFKVTLTGSANLSTFLHESGHVFLEVTRKAAAKDAKLAADLSTLEQWAGVKPGATWDTEALEKFARGFEAYLREGKAPSSALAQVFASAKTWLMLVYRSLRGLDVELDDNVRGVMDRLLATDAEIAQAQKESGLLPAFRSADVADMTDAQFAAYQEKWNAAAQEARQKLESEAVEEARRATSEEYAQIHAAVAEEVQGSPAFNAWEVLSGRERLDGAEVDEEIKGRKLDRAAVYSLLEAAGSPERKSRLRGITDEAGLDPDEAAPYFGFASGHHLVQALAGIQSRLRYVKAETIRRMAEKYPGFDGSREWMAKRAEQHVHSDAVAIALRTELEVAGKKVGADARSAAEVLKQGARERVATMTDPEMRADRYRRAGETAGREYIEHMAAKRFPQAFDAKRRQMWNFFMAREVAKAREEVERIRGYLRDFEDVRAQARLGKAGPNYRDAMNALLVGIHLRKESLLAVRRRNSLAKYVAAMEAEGDVVAPQLKEMSELKSYREMTLAELQGVEAAAANIDAMARLKGKLLLLKEKRDLARTAQDLATHIRANLGDKAKPIPGDLQALEKSKEWLRKGDSHLKKIEFIARRLDGGKTAGLAHQLLFQPFRDAQNARYLLQDQVLSGLMKPFRELSVERRARYAERVAFLYSPKSGKMVHLSRRNVLSVVLNLGNDGNRERLLQGYGWTHEQVLARLDQLLDDGDVEIANHIWKSVDSLWPTIKSLAERFVGLPPRRVEATPFTLPSGKKLAGGYYPIVKSRRLSYLGQQIAEREDARWEANFFAPVVEHGFTQARGKDMSPLELSLDVVPHHLDKVVHYLTHYEAVRGVDRLLQRGDVRAAISEGMGNEYYNLFRPWLESIAGAAGSQEALAFHGMAFRKMRLGSSVVLLFGKIPTGVKQSLGLLTSAKEIKQKHMISGLRKFMTEGWGEVSRESPEFKYIDKQLDRDTRELFEALESSFTELGGLKRTIAKFSAAPIMVIQKFVNAVTWYAAREQALEEGHANPVAYADSIVTMTQTGGGVKDLAAVQRGGEFSKLFTVMYSYRSVLYNQLTEGTNRRGGKAALEFAARFWWLILAPVLVEELLFKGVRDHGKDKEDEEDVVKRVSTEVLLLPFSTVPGLGDAAQAGVQGRTPRGAPWVDTVYRAAVTAGRTARGEHLGKQDAKAVSDVVGSILVQPTAGLWNLGEYTTRLASGELEEPVQDLLLRNPSWWE